MNSPIFRRRLQAGVAFLLVAALAGCATPWDKYPAGGGSATATATASGTVPSGWIAPTGSQPTTLAEFYAQPITWGSCAQTSAECATIWAPVNWSDPGQGAITLALARVPATGPNPQGSLLSNPGGPGGSGIEFLEYFAKLVSPAVKQNFHLVSFDPRGVQLSTPINCGSDAELDKYFLTDYTYESQADLDQAIAANKAFGERCLELTGPVLGHVDTESAARDMDLMRAVLGDKKLTYVGYSYGTELGATYAGLFPDKVGRLVLDGAVDPSLTSDQMTIQQAQGFEQAFRTYVADCLTSTQCPLTGPVENGMKQIRDLVKQAQAKPLPTSGGEPLNGSMAYYGVIVAMYDDSSWPTLSKALREAMQNNNGDVLHYLANVYLDRDNKGHWTSNSKQAFGAINCLDAPDTPRNYEQMLAWRDEVAKVAPLVADDFTLGSGCQGWPFAATGKPAPITAAGAAPIVVIGTTGDPATPYQWSKNLASQLSSGVLVTWNGEGHTAYGRSNKCIADAVEGYLIQGIVPADGTTC